MYRLGQLMCRNNASYYKRCSVTNAHSILTLDDMPHPKELPIFGTKLALMAAGSGSKYITTMISFIFSLLSYHFPTTFNLRSKFPLPFATFFLVMLGIFDSIKTLLASLLHWAPWDLNLISEPLHEYINNRHKQLGSIFYERLGGNTKLVFISDPTLMKTLFLNLEGKYPAHILPEPWVLYEKLYGAKRGLFFMNNEEWLTNRRIVNKHVLREDSEKWLEQPITETINNFVKIWKIKAQGGTLVPDLESDLYRLSTDVIINVLLGAQSMTTSPYYDELLDMFSESVKKIFETTTKLYALPVSCYQRLDLKPWRDFKECVDTSILLAQKIVQEMLEQKAINKGLIQKLCQEQMTDDTITRIVADFVIAAGDTTTYTTLWTLLLLSNNELEISQIRERDMTYVKHVIKEAMRLYPVAPFLTRILPRESILGGYVLKKGTPVIASIYTIGRDEKNFSRADTFAPYRWSRNDPRKLGLVNHVPSASLPFALGARSCIGKKIAMLQLTEVITQIVSHFDFTCVNSNEVNAITSQVLVPNREIKLKLTLRQDKSRTQV